MLHLTSLESDGIRLDWPHAREGHRALVGFACREAAENDVHTWKHAD